MTYEEIKERVKDNEPDWESFFNELTNGFAILQVRDDLPERRDIHFCSYEQAVKYLQRNPCRDDYCMLAAEAFTSAEMADIRSEFPNLGANISIGEYVFRKFNMDSRPGVEDGYYGTSLSISDIILVKENKQTTALYVDSFGFKELKGFEPLKYFEKADMTKGDNHER